MNPPRLLCFGNLTIDEVVLPDGRVQANCTGGDCFYAAVAARLFEPAVEMVAPVGTDLPGEVLADIESSGLSSAGLRPRPAPTIRNRVVYESSGERMWTLLTPAEDFHLLSPVPDDVPAGWRAASAALVLAMTLEAQETLVANLAAEACPLVALDPQEDYIIGNEARLQALITRADIFLPSEIEIERLLGHRDARGAAIALSGLGPRIVVVKRGAAGVTVFDGCTKSFNEVPAYAATAVDTTGAGDSFCGAFVASYVRNPNDIVGAAQAGIVAASFAVEEFGIAGLLAATKAKVASRLRELQSLPCN